MNNQSKNMALVADMQYQEQITSDALNRKFLGVIKAGIYRGFKCNIAGGLNIIIGDCSGKNTAIIEKSGRCTTVHLQYPVSVNLEAGQHSAIVLDAFYQIGVKTKQVDPSSAIDAATISAIPFSTIEPHHVVICDVNVPVGATQITNDMISTSSQSKPIVPAKVVEQLVVQMDTIKKRGLSRLKKSKTMEPAFKVKDNALLFNCDILGVIGNTFFSAKENDTLTLPELSKGTDYAIYATTTGFVVSNNFTCPENHSQEDVKRIGGFHFQDGFINA
ncbi:hypothetical protein I3271_05265, partial [Photobacterium leiognathi]|nr:hypothetical protein [Photobacterium leiognathi]